MWLQSFFGDVSVLNVCKLITNYAIKFFKCSGKKLLPNVHQKMLFYIWRELVKHYVAHGCLFTYYLTKELYHWEKTHPSLITLLMTNIVWTTLMPHNHIDFIAGKAYMHKRATVKSHSNKNNKWCIKQNLKIHWIDLKNLKNCELK